MKWRRMLLREEAFLGSEFSQRTHHTGEHIGNQHGQSDDDRCLSDLRITDPTDDKTRIQETKGGLLEDSYRWVLENPEFQLWRNDEQCPLLWIKGDPGKGKTMLLCGIIDELKKSEDKTCVLSYFFCQATDLRINTATAKYDHAGKSLFEDANSWVALSKIFTNIVQDSRLGSTYLIVDALDECIKDMTRLLEFIVQISSKCSCVKWIISSRNSLEIIERLEMAENKIKLCLELNSGSISAAVGNYIEYKVSELVKWKKYDDRTRITVRDYLSLHSQDTFLWVALVCQHLKSIRHYETREKLEMFPPGLDSIYQQMINSLFGVNKSYCEQVVAIMTIAYWPLSLYELASLIEPSIDPESMEGPVNDCGSFFTIRENTVYFVHQSAKDFLAITVSNTVFPSGMKAVHYSIFSRSLLAMEKELRRDIYGLQHPGFSIEQVKVPDTDPLSAVRYACLYWVDHLSSGGVGEKSNALRDDGEVHKFVRTKFLHWLEALSLTKGMATGVLSILKLENLLEKTAETSELARLVVDARRFILYFRSIIESNPLQVYASTLVFSPTRSKIRQLFEQDYPNWILTEPVMEEHWSACLQTLECYQGGEIESIAYSHNNKYLASAGRNVKIWDTVTGVCIHTFDPHNDGTLAPYSISFSCDDETVVYASEQYSCYSIRRWNIRTGMLVDAIYIGRQEAAWFLILAADGTRLLSTSRGIIQVWDATTGACISTIDRSKHMHSLAFSSNGRFLTVVSKERTLEVWAVHTGKCQCTFNGDYTQLCTKNQLAISSEGAYIAVVRCQDVLIWDTLKSTHLRTLNTNSYVEYIAFSPDSTQIASCSGRINIWEVITGNCLQTFKSNDDSLRSITFSYDRKHLAYGLDAQIRILDLTIRNKSSLEDSYPIKSVTLSHDDKYVATVSSNDIKIWDTFPGICVKTIHVEDIGPCQSAIFSPDLSQFLTYSRSTAKLWSVIGCNNLWEFTHHSCDIISAAFSPDASHILLVCRGGQVKIYDTIGNGLRTFRIVDRDNDTTWRGFLKSRNADRVYDIVALSRDNKFMALSGNNRLIRVCDMDNKKCIQCCRRADIYVNSLTFSHDNKYLAASGMNIEVWEVSSGVCRYAFDGLYVDHISFDSTGRYLHCNFGAILLDMSPTEKVVPQSQLKTHGLGFSRYAEWITWNSENVLWIPPEFRPVSKDIVQLTVALSLQSQRVLIFKFASLSSVNAAYDWQQRWQRKRVKGSQMVSDATKIATAKANKRVIAIIKSRILRLTTRR
ncbi:hypothetical protein F5884DRAFT_898507 [Xylogone sp. PMI_703]|nr:hypothetical protein F5884DRAFT_898507 [Xylogone sp. PMI_703]